MMAPARSQFSQCREQLRCRRRALGVLPVGSMPRQDAKREIELAALEMDRKRREEPGKRMGKADVKAQCADIRLPADNEDLRRERDEARGSAVRVGFEIGKRRHRLVVEIESARIDERLERLQRQPVARDGGGQRRRHRVGRDLVPARTAQYVAPPLQPDFPRHGLANDLTHAGDFQVEGVERKQRVATLGGSKQGGEKAILVRRAYEPLAMGECILHERVSRLRSPQAFTAQSCANVGLEGTLANLWLPRGPGYDFADEVFAFSAGSSASMRVVPTPR